MIISWPSKIQLEMRFRYAAAAAAEARAEIKSCAFPFPKWNPFDSALVRPLRLLIIRSANAADALTHFEIVRNI